MSSYPYILGRRNIKSNIKSSNFLKTDRLVQSAESSRVLGGGGKRLRRTVPVERVGKVIGGLVLEGFQCNHKEFELNTLWDREPAKGPEDGG